MARTHEQEQMINAIVEDSHLDVLSKVSSGTELDWLEKQCLATIFNGGVLVSEKVKKLVRELKDSGKL